MSELVIRTRTTPPATLVTLVGDLDTLHAAELRGHLRAVPAGDLVLDVSGVRFLDAAGLTVLVELHARLERADARLVLVGVPRRVRRVIAITGVDQVLLASPTADDAVALLLDTRQPSKPWHHSIGDGSRRPTVRTARPAQ
ncbi:STAS domain-containing protein [Pseudonocardia sp.]|uniref:STAS domain-containing protein n=1 Tax=Pseudonocardia sp. TaxID=60912 RepID=UPI0031FDE31B